MRYYALAAMNTPSWTRPRPSSSTRSRARSSWAFCGSARAGTRSKTSSTARCPRAARQRDV